MFAVPALPAASSTRTCNVLLLTSVTPLNVYVVPVTVAVLQLDPLSNDTLTTSPVTNAALKAPVIVCDAVFVIKSELVPVSAENTTVLTVVVGAVVSTLYKLLSATKLWVIVAVLPAKSTIVPPLRPKLFATILIPSRSV